jgi:hypothetical protein
VRDGLDRWWQHARRTGAPAPTSDTASPEEAKRLKQLDFIRQRVAGTANLPPPHGMEPESTEPSSRREVLP